jgi:hypothetical protein
MRFGLIKDAVGRHQLFRRAPACKMRESTSLGKIIICLPDWNARVAWNRKFC